MEHRSLRPVVLVCLLALMPLASAKSQEIPEEAAKLRIAQSLERAGEYEKAARLYEELYSRNPLNYVFFDGLHRMEVQLKEYEKAVSLVQRRLEQYPNDLALLGLLGEDYLKWGKEAEAIATWERALSVDEKNQNAYRTISNILLQNRLFAKSVEILLRGRQKTGNPNLFATELGFGYTLLGSYNEATREYVRTLKDNPGLLSFVQTRMTLFTTKPDGLKAAVGVVKEAVQADKKDLLLLRLLAWLYLEGKEFESAFSVYRLIDELSGTTGRELLTFADRSLKEKAFSVAGQAYKEVIERYPKAQIVPVAKFGYARVVEELSALGETVGRERTIDSPSREEQALRPESEPTYGGAIARYNEIVHDYPQSELALQSLYRIGEIRFDKFFDIDGALRALDQIERQFPANRLMPAVGLKAGEIFVAKGDLETAAERYAKVRQNPLAGQDEKDRALFSLAELDYFQGNFDSAVARLTGLLGNLSADIANDALLLSQFIKEHLTGNPSTLREYARADLLERQRKFSEATAVLEELLSMPSNSPIVDDVLLKLGHLQATVGDPRGALSTYEKLIVDHPESILRDKAQFNIAEIYELSLKDKQKAIGAYHTLLEQYPNSLYLDEARKRIRQLRGDNL
jgi:tetratricopeptide (TPR) repeat protein